MTSPLPTVWIEGCARPGETPWQGEVAGPDQWTLGVALADEDTGTEFDGMYDSPLVALYTSTAFQTGASFTGFREDAYDFTLAFWIVETPGSLWRVNETAFRLAWDVKLPTRIHVETEESHRYLEVRLASKPKRTFGYDPNGEKASLLLLPLKAAYPRWLEPDWGENTASDHPSKFVTTTDTTVSGYEDGFVTVWNPTASPQWARWSVQGAAGIIWTLPDFSWGQEAIHDRPAGVDALRKITLEELIAGEHLKIDTNPEAIDGMYNSDLDTEVYLRQQVEFMYPIPPRTPPTQIPIRVSKAPIGAGVQVRCPLEWHQPWGLH